MNPTRIENVKIKMELDYDAYLRNKEAVTALTSVENVREGDKLKITYDFSCWYLGDIVEKLTAVETICNDPATIKTASCSELEEGRILVYKVLRKLDDVIRQVRERNDDPFRWRREPEPTPGPRVRRTWLEWWRGE
ncbi:MAG: hypothetical protein AMS22_06080 [Thiotrichales bacterium SG8_50]|nr:MAG: hypothetical protein AMS22_06080 [Thiotrichales bacterium SG8_50]